MQWVQGEEGGDKGASPQRAREPPQEDKKQDSIKGMEKEARQVVAGGIQPIELHIELMGHPR